MSDIKTKKYIKGISLSELNYIDESVSKISPKTSLDVPLANYRDFIVRSDSYFRVILYKMREVAQSIMNEKELKLFKETQKKPSIEFCGKNLKFRSETIDLVLTESDKLAFRGLSMCGLVWRCPMCAIKILQGRSAELSEYLTLHNQNDFKTGFCTLTIPHTKDMPLKETLNKINSNYNKFQNTRWYKKHKDQIIGQVKALEITYTYLNGWHPHLHILFFYNHNDLDKIQDFQKELVARWCDFRDNNARLIGQDFQICYDNSIDAYLTKWDIIKEVTQQHVKKSSGFTPFDALKKIGLKEYASKNKRFFYVEKYREYIETTRGKHRLSISPKLSKYYPSVKVKTDKEILKDEKIEKVLLRFQYIIWLQITRKGLQPHIINAYLQNGEEGLLDLLRMAEIDFKEVLDENEIKMLI